MGVHNEAPLRRPAHPRRCDVHHGVLGLHDIAKTAEPQCGFLLQKLPPGLWPSIVRWQEFMHPMHDRLRPSRAMPTPSNVIDCFTKPIDIVVRLKNGILGEQALLENPRAGLLFLDYWLFFPQYVDLAPDAAAEPCATLVLYMFLLMDRLQDATLKSLLVADLLRLCGGSATAFWRLIGRQTAHLAQQPFVLAWPMVWEKHFELAAHLASAPELQCPVMARPVFAAVVAAGRRCLTMDAWHEGAVQATRLLCTFCAISVDSRTLVRAIDAGAIELVWEIGRAGAGYDTSYFASHVASSLSLATVVRAAARRYGHILGFEEDPDWIDRGENVKLIRRAYHTHYPDYYQGRKKKDWKSAMKCQNAQGPHNKTVRICGCGEVFYCSGSCQRMHWDALHGALCSGNEPWRMNGRVSLNDILYLTMHVRDCIRRSQAQLVGLMAQKRLGPNQQFTITTDLSDPLAGQSGSVDMYDIVPNSSREIVRVKVWFRVGGIRRLQSLPLTYRIDDFRRVTKLS